MFRIFILIPIIFTTGCVTTSKMSVHCDKVVNIHEPFDGNMNVGVRVEFFRDHTKK